MPTYHHSLSRGLSVIGAVFALTLGMTSISSAAATVVKIGWPTADSKIDPYAITAHYFAEELEKAAPGKYDIQFFGNHQLGDETEMLQGLRLGTLEFGVFTGTYVGNIVPAFQLNDLPFLYANSQQAHETLDGKAGELMQEKLAKKGMISLGFAEAGFREVINNKRPITKPDDLGGIRLRVQPSDIFISSFRALGANPVPMSWSDVFTAVQQGTIDGLEIPLAVIYANKYPEVTKYLSLTNHTYNALSLLASGRTWKKMSADEQKVVQAAAKKAIARQRKTVADNNVEMLQKLKDAGMQVNEIPDLSQFRKRAAGIYDEYRKTIGADVVDAALKQVAQ